MVLKKSQYFPFTIFPRVHTKILIFFDNTKRIATEILITQRAVPIYDVGNTKIEEDMN